MDKLRQLEGSKHILYRKLIYHTKGHFHQDYNYLEPFDQTTETHNYVNPAISE